MNARIFLSALLVTLFAAAPAAAQIRIDADAGARANLEGSTVRLSADGSVSQNASTTEREGLPRNAAGIEIRAAAQVYTDEDLNAYEENLLVVNRNVADADSSNSRVAVSYWHEGRFLGLFKVKVESRTTAEIGDEDVLTVRTDMPWWSFLVFGLGNVQGDVQYALQSDGEFSKNVLAREDAQARARALEAIMTAHANVRH